MSGYASPKMNIKFLQQQISNTSHTVIKIYNHMRSEIPTVVYTKNTVFWNTIWLQILGTLGRNIMHPSSGLKVDAVCSAKVCKFLLDCTWNLN